jgi:NAD(P)-dependent dehydrogenase (short-subunit alcohol dehydrogenase family)
MGVLDGKVAVITGGSSGIGEQGVRLFTEQGACVIIADIDDDNGNRLAQELGGSTAFVHTDVRNEKQVEETLNYAVETFGGLDFLWNNAGAAAQVPPQIAKVPVEGFERIMSISLRGVFLGMKFAAPIMKRQGSGSIINTASVAGVRAGFATHIYSAAKAAIIQLTRSVAMELGESGIRVNCICPSGVATTVLGDSAHITADERKRMDTMKAFIGALNPMKRACSAGDVAQAALWLFNDDTAGFVNGHILVVDGGVTGGNLWSLLQKETDDFLSSVGLETMERGI